MKNYNLALLAEAKKWIGVHEDKSKGDNKGLEVEMFQKAVDGKAQGESWCMAFIQFCIKKVEEENKIQCLLFKSEHCLTVLRESQMKVVKQPQPGDLIIWRFGNTSNGHVGVISKIIDESHIETIEGNTSDSASVERNGDGVYAKKRSLKGSESMRVVGFLRPF